jgi:hypothetical protein
MSGDFEKLSVVHRRRLRQVWRSAGWPCQDLIEVELIAAGLLERHVDGVGRDTVRVSDAGVQMLAATLQRNRHARSPHEELVTRVAMLMHRAGRLVWRGISLRAPLESGLSWAIAMPDVFSVRHTTVEAYLEPVIHEIKVSRADLLGDVRSADKRAAYLALAGECWYVLKDGIGGESDVPETCGVMLASASGLDVLRPAPRREQSLSFATWMALAKAARCDFGDDEAQAML